MNHLLSPSQNHRFQVSFDRRVTSQANHLLALLSQPIQKLTDRARAEARVSASQPGSYRESYSLLQDRGRADARVTASQPSSYRESYSLLRECIQRACCRNSKMGASSRPRDVRLIEKVTAFEYCYQWIRAAAGWTSNHKRLVSKSS